MKTNYKDLKIRYSLSERECWANLPPWKQKIIIECKENGWDDRILTEFSKEIIRLAEDESYELNEKYPPVPDISSSLSVDKDKDKEKDIIKINV